MRVLEYYYYYYYYYDYFYTTVAATVCWCTKADFKTGFTSSATCEREKRARTDANYTPIARQCHTKGQQGKASDRERGEKRERIVPTRTPQKTYGTHASLIVSKGVET